MAQSPSFARDFDAFYRDHFVPEHRHPLNVALHLVAVLGGTLFLALTLPSSAPWLALLYPVVHAAPGLLGHRLFERNAQVGDLRVTREDFPIHWFLVANHRLAWEVMTSPWRRPRSPEPGAPPS